MQSGNLVIDIVTRKAFLGGEELRLSENEFGILAVLVERKGEAVPRRWLFENIVSGEDIRLVDYCVKWLREKIEKDLSNPRFTIVRGVGYLFVG